jgi:hypothetical protein
MMALEVLAFKLMLLVDMTYMMTRLRGSATGGLRWTWFLSPTG